MARRLGQQVGLGPAAFFRDACGLLAERPLRLSVTHLVSHLLREVESAVRSVLEPPKAGAGAKDRHRAKIEAVLRELEIPLDDPVAEFWLGLAREDNSDGLARRAHRSALDVPRPPGPAFFALVAGFELVLDAILERFETRYFEVYERLDKLLAIPTPTRESAKSIRNNFPGSYAVSNYFFSRATTAWIKPLKAEGFFQAPPPPQLDEDAGTLQLPSWPESRFLVRVAPQAPTDVVDVAIEIPATENARVNYDLIKIALACPPESATKLVPKIVSAISSRYGVLIPHEAGALIVSMCRGEHVEEAVALTQALLDRVPTDYGPSSSVDAYEYGTILREHIPSIVEMAGVQVLAMLCRVLAEVIRSDSERAAVSGRDTSLIWRPNIESSGSLRAETDVRQSLVDAVRDAATSLTDAHPEKIIEIIRELESHDWTLFQRISLWLLAQHTEQNLELTTTRLIDPALISNRYIEREYLLLARVAAHGLDTGDVRRLLRSIDAGPHAADVAKADGKSPRRAAGLDPESREWIARWQRNRLAALQSVLPPEWNARYQALVAEYGDAPNPTEALPEPFAVWGEESPISPSELAAMPTATLVEFLRTWQAPPNRWGAPSQASLRGALSSAVQGDAERRSADLDLFIGLPAVYIGEVISGLYQARTNDAVLDWNAVIKLCEWINQQAKEELAALDCGPAFRQWRQPRLDMLRLLMGGLNPGPSPISANLDTRVWAVIVDSCADADPDTDREAGATAEGYGGFMGLALGLVRPQAIRAVISYGLSLRRRSPDTDISAVLALLDQHLDPAIDPSKSVRSIYGELFPPLAWLDPEWAAARVESIFPLDVEENEFLDAAWGAYLGGGRITDVAWNLLTNRYSMAIDRLEAIDDYHVEESLVAQIGGHLINRLWNGYLSPDSHDGLLQRYYAKLTPKVATHLMWRIGVSLDPTALPDPMVIVRLRAFWEFRVGAVKQGADARELAEFGHWFASGLFEPKWSFAQLLTTLSLAGEVQGEAAVLAKAAGLAAEHLQASLTVLERWVSLERHTWWLTVSLDSIRAILQLGVAGDPTAVETSQKVISILLARDDGADLRDVLRKSP
ncbi:hypothetical protein [Actinoallomurus acaciae]|uniref:Uncharacterized protein n=1 Tax=Actinoallomurus acaciae TaxID=502577 RepID=A0ABV5Y7E1_9ACTN